MSDATPTEEGNGSPSLGGQVEEICDRFEAAWKAGRRPPIEDYLGEVPEPGRGVLLRALVELELTYRGQNGERPTPEEYQLRFPQHVAVIETILGAASPPRAARPRAGADHNLLFGMLALQNNFIDRDTLVAAFSAWVADKSRTLGQVLLGSGAVDAETHALLEALARKHLQMHGRDLEESLAALSSLGSVRDDLERLDDSELQTCLTRVPSNHDRTDPDVTALHARTAGTSTAAGMRFRVLRLHRTGGLGAVYVAHDEELHREVALKEIRDRHAHDPDSRSRFLQEAEITGRLEHPGIIPVYGLGTYADGRPFYAMRFIKGDNLKDAIARFHEADAPGRDPGERALALRELLRRFLDVCNAMAYAHSRGILHRDLKPNNILLGPYGETLVVDWGLAKPVGRPEEASRTDEVTLRPDSAGSSKSTLPGDTPGTPAYMSPEQADGDVDRLGLASDVYSLGATLYCLLTGRAPVEDPDVDVVLGKVRRGEFPPPRTVNRAIDPALEAICLKAMALRPDDRYVTPGALADDIEHSLAGEPVSAYPENRTERVTRWMGRHRSAVRAAVATLLILTVGAIAFAFFLEQARRQEQKARKNEQFALVQVQKARATEALALTDAQRQRDLAEEKNRLARDAMNVLDGIVNNPAPGQEDPGKRLATIKAVLAESTALLPDPTANLNLDFEAKDPPPKKASEKPKGWDIGGEGYEIHVDPTAAHSGRQSLRTHFKQGSIGRFGHASREVPAATAAGKQVRVSGYIKTEGISTGYAGLWCRVDTRDGTIALDTMGTRYDHVDPKTGLPLWDDNMKGRGVSGTTPWARFQIELPVSAGATRIVFGGLLAGDGTAWFDELAVDIDGKPLAEALAALPMPRPSTDLNLDFEVDEPKFETPKRWYVSGRGSPAGGGGKGYDLELDATTAKSGRQSLRLRSTGKAQEGQFGVFTQSIPASVAAGKRVRVSGHIKTDGITKGYAGLWCRIDGQNHKQLGFDNMAVRQGPDGVYKSDDRGVRGTTPWKHYQVEVDVDARAENIVFGGLLSDEGTAWFDDMAIEVDGRPLVEALASEPTKEQIVSGLTNAYRPLSFSVNEPPTWTRLNTSTFAVPGETIIAWRTHSEDEVVIFLQKAGQAVSPRFLLDSSALSVKQARKAEFKAAEVKTVAGMRAMWLVFTSKGTGQAVDGKSDIPTTQHWVAIPREKDVLVLLLKTPADRYEAALKEFEEMLKTLKVEGKQTKEQAEAQ
jgi:serine/threonine protein kinase